MSHALSVSAIVALIALASPAAAQPVQRPTRYLIDVPARPPQVVVVTSPPPPPVTTVVVHTPQPQPVYTVHHHDYDDAFERDPYETDGVVVAGVGLGGMMFLGEGAPGVAASYHLHLGLAVGPAEFALDADLVPAIDGSHAFSSWAGSFAYRFFDRADVHPVLSAGLAALVHDADGMQPHTELGAVVRAGLELAVRVDGGALALGLDISEHHALTGRDQMTTIADAVQLGAHLNYRF